VGESAGNEDQDGEEIKVKWKTTWDKNKKKKA
jgi:hypothetical protein